MDGIRQQLFIDYMYYLHETDRFDATKARYAKHVLYDINIRPTGLAG